MSSIFYWWLMLILTLLTKGKGSFIFQKLINGLPLNFLWKLNEPFPNKFFLPLIQRLLSVCLPYADTHSTIRVYEYLPVLPTQLLFFLPLLINFKNQIFIGLISEPWVPLSSLIYFNFKSRLLNYENELKRSKYQTQPTSLFEAPVFLSISSRSSSSSICCSFFSFGFLLQMRFHLSTFKHRHFTWILWWIDSH